MPSLLNKNSLCQLHAFRTAGQSFAKARDEFPAKMSSASVLEGKAMTQARVHTYTHTCIHTYMHTYIHACIHACTHTHTHTHARARTHTCTHFTYPNHTAPYVPSSMAELSNQPRRTSAHRGLEISLVTTIVFLHTHPNCNHKLKAKIPNRTLRRIISKSIGTEKTDCERMHSKMSLSSVEKTPPTPPQLSTEHTHR